MLSFTVLGTFWLAQHTLLGILGRCDRTLTWINLGFLFVVSLLPFSAALLAHFVHLRLAAACTGSTSCCSAPRWNGALGTGAPRSCRIAPGRRTRGSAPSGAGYCWPSPCNALAALICLISTPASVIALAVVQLYFIVSPACRIPGGSDAAAAQTINALVAGDC
jgi:hypothetical protein